MNILQVASEVVPFAKTGGLADVAGALPRALAALGHNPTVVMPCYPLARGDGSLLPTEWKLEIPIGKKLVEAEVYRSTLPDSSVPVYFVDQPGYYDRESLYGERGKDYLDNSERFIFFSRAALEIASRLPFNIDVIHANDWQTGLVPVYLQEIYRSLPGLQAAGTLLTVHNMGYQGKFWHWDMLLTGLDWRLFNWRHLEFYGHLNMLKAGIVFADLVNTVSRRYAEEIQTSEFGCGLEGVLQSRKGDLYGIINGVDYAVWNPATDPAIAANYDDRTVGEGKPRCKRSLQNELGLPVRVDVPLLAMVTRLEDQKGLDLLLAVLESLLGGDVQLVILGTGQAKYQDALVQLSQRFPRRLIVQLGFDELLAHRIYSGADIFLMPSRYEPCGLNQFISLKYGAVPIVRATGGLADSIVDGAPEAITGGEANGFVFGPYAPDALADAVRRALACRQNPETWNKLVQNGMRQDWSWRRSALEYAKLYELIRSRHVKREA